MKILFLISGRRVPSSRFRVLAFLPYLRAAGHRCTVACSFPEKYDDFRLIGWTASQRLKRLVRRWHLARARWGRYDVVVIERELFDNETWDLEAEFRRVAKSLVLDVDDAVFLRHPEKFDHLARMCDRVIVGNRFLKERIAPLNSDIVVIPTCVDLNHYPQKPQSAAAGPVVVGWIGTTSNVGYLRVVAPTLRRLATQCRFELRVIAPNDAPLRELDLTGVDVRFVTWAADSEIDELLQFDIGLMPLPDEDEWNIYKCGLKLLQYMSIGIPGVASPVGVNAEIVTHGDNGFLARNDIEWESSLRRLIDDAPLREEVGKRARQTVQERYSVEANLPLLIDALATAGSPQRTSVE